MRGGQSFVHISSNLLQSVIFLLLLVGRTKSLGTALLQSNYGNSIKCDTTGNAEEICCFIVFGGEKENLATTASIHIVFTSHFTNDSFIPRCIICDIYITVLLLWPVPRAPRSRLIWPLKLCPRFLPCVRCICIRRLRKAFIRFSQG